ncbi:MAG: UvrD-helicase domain-containing protein [Planctomycetes bacterium]|nr:UvrD-helicase domain-containing protein [Planctomycetota bacterium]
MNLNPQQLRAVHHATGPLLILAGAGTGKTRVITERMAHLLDQGVRPENLLGVTFTNKAAAEMRSRLTKMVGRRHRLKHLVVSTFHSLAVRILRRDAARLGYTPGFGICDYGEQAAIVRKALATVRGGATLAVDDVLRRIGAGKNRGLLPEDCRRQAIEEDEMVLAAVYRRYQEALRRQNCLDFDDLLLQTLILFREHEDALTHWRDRFRYIMVDEFQDTNGVQFDLVRLLAAPRDNLCVVGDDDQSIYAWRGAMAGNILKFHDRYPAAVTVTLEQNYRSTTTILAAANAVIRNNGGRREKNLWSDLGQGRRIGLIPYNDQHEEACGIAAAVRTRVAEEGGRLRFGDFAVIIRANAQSRPLEDEFLAARIPFEVIGGQSLFDRKEARDVMSFLSLVANPDADNHLLRVINVPPRGIGGKTVDALSAHAAGNGVRLADLLARPETVPGLTAQATAACRRLADQIAGWRERVREHGFDGLVEYILADTAYQEELAHLYRDPLESASRWREALEVGESLAAFAAANPQADRLAVLAEFLGDAMLAGRQESGRKAPDNAVRIITAHSAKGLEFPVVFIPGLEEEIFPHKNAIEADTVEEERRLF